MFLHHFYAINPAQKRGLRIPPHWNKLVRFWFQVAWQGWAERSPSGRPPALTWHIKAGRSRWLFPQQRVTSARWQTQSHRAERLREALTRHPMGHADFQETQRFSSIFFFLPAWMLPYEWLISGKAPRMGDGRNKTSWATWSVPHPDGDRWLLRVPERLLPSKVNRLAVFPPLLVKLFHDLMKNMVMKSFHVFIISICILYYNINL